MKFVFLHRYCTKPSEFILQCSPLKRDDFVDVLEELVTTRKAYLNDHRYDPSEIYSDEFLEELQGIVSLTNAFKVILTKFHCSHSGSQEGTRRFP